MDVHIEKGGARVAVEIAIHSKPEWETHNIRKNLVAGYDRVLALYLDPALLEATRTNFTADATKEELSNVTFVEVGRFEDYL